MIFTRRKYNNKHQNQKYQYFFDINKRENNRIQEKIQDNYNIQNLQNQYQREKQCKQEYFTQQLYQRDQNNNKTSLFFQFPTGISDFDALDQQFHSDNCDGIYNFETIDCNQFTQKSENE